MSEIKGFDKGKIREMQRMAMIKVPHIQFDFEELRKACEGIPSFSEAVRMEVEKHMKEENTNIEIANICEMAIRYLDMVQANEDKYKQGLQDAWELAKKILYGIDRQLVEIFDVKVEPVFFDLTHKRAIINDHTPQEAFAKFKAFEDAQKAIKVGDVVRFKTDHDICLVVTKLRADAFDAINESGATYSGRCYEDWEKTGQHIDIESVLEQIKKV